VNETASNRTLNETWRGWRNRQDDRDPVAGGAAGPTHA